jgi:CDP-diglyceride synthetase
MLRTRVITAMVLFAAFFGALFYLPPLGWLFFVTAIAGVAAWEWGALMRLGAAGQVSLGVLLAVLCAIVAVLEPAAVGLGAGFDAAAWRLGAFSICRRRFSGYCWCRSGCNGAGLLPTLFSLWRLAWCCSCRYGWR